MDVVFEHALRAEWPGRQGPRLPAAVQTAAQGGAHRLVAHTLVITLFTQHGLLWLRARPRCAADGLSPREATVARLVVRGLTHKDRKSKRLNSSHSQISYAVFCLKKKKKKSTTYEL